MVSVSYMQISTFNKEFHILQEIMHKKIVITRNPDRHNKNFASVQLLKVYRFNKQCNNGFLLKRPSLYRFYIKAGFITLNLPLQKTPLKVIGIIGVLFSFHVISLFQTFNSFSPLLGPFSSCSKEAAQETSCNFLKHINTKIKYKILSSINKFSSLLVLNNSFICIYFKNIPCPYYRTTMNLNIL